MRHAITGILFHVEEGMTRLVQESPTAQQKGIGNGLSTTLESLNKGIARKVVRSPRNIAGVTEAVINNYEFLASTAILVKSEQ